MKPSKKIFGFQHFNDNFEPKTYNYRQQKAEKLREKPNFAESWNTETRKSREKPNFAENWNNETRKQIKNEN